jgi:hypothetical protein
MSNLEMTEDEFQRLMAAFTYEAMPPTTTTALDAPAPPLSDAPSSRASINPILQQDFPQSSAPADHHHSNVANEQAAQVASHTLGAPAPLLGRLPYTYAEGFQPCPEFMQSFASEYAHRAVGMPNSGGMPMPPPLQLQQQQMIAFGYGCMFCRAITPYVSALSLSWNFLEDARPSAGYLGQDTLAISTSWIAPGAPQQPLPATFLCGDCGKYHLYYCPICPPLNFISGRTRRSPVLALMLTHPVSQQQHRAVPTITRCPDCSLRRSGRMFRTRYSHI